MSLIYIDFKRRQVVENIAEACRSLSPKETFRTAPDRLGHFDHMIEGIQARYGSKQPDSGCVFKQPLKSNIFDSYGYGCIHNSIHQYRGGKYWNEPMPMPADLRAIETYLKKRAGKVLRLGSKSDPFMWMDHKYQITKSILEIANENDIQLVIHTMSDLCAHNDYAYLLKNGDHSIVMHMGFEHLKDSPSEALETLERLVSPGAPSMKRRQMAVNKLKDMDVDVRLEYTRLESIISNKSKFQRLCRATGTGPDYWIGENRDKGLSFGDER